MDQNTAGLRTEATTVESLGDLGFTLEWMRLSGLLRRQGDLMRHLLYLLLRQRETIALMNFSEFQKVALDQIQLLEELDNVRKAVEEQIALLSAALLPDGEPSLGRLLPFAPEKTRAGLEEARGRIERLAVEIQRISRRNQRLLATLGELQARQYEAVMEAAGLLTGTYSDRGTDSSRVSLCDVVA